jgi:two-component system cell cycle sensor histidine kinase/response regulator CckA
LAERLGGVMIGVEESTDPQRVDTGKSKDAEGDYPLVVLVAEDDAALLSILSEAIRDQGFEVVTATNGVEALDAYREYSDRIRIVVADVVMPEMDGLTAAVEMRKINPYLCFIFISGYGPERINEIGITIEDIPSSVFFRKPFAFKDVIAMVRELESEHEA